MIYMNKYESIVIITDEICEKERKKVIDKITEFVKKNGEKVETKEIGIKRLAYEVNKRKQGYFVQINFNANPEVIYELERIYRITDEIMKFLTIKI